MLYPIITSISPISPGQNNQTEQNDTQDNTDTEANSGANSETNTQSTGNASTTSGASTSNGVAGKSATTTAGLKPMEFGPEERAAGLDADALRDAAIVTQIKLQNDLIISKLDAQPTATVYVAEAEEAETPPADPAVSAYMEHTLAEIDEHQEAA